MTRVLGIDLSLTGTGMCRIVTGDHPTLVETVTFATKPADPVTLDSRGTRLATIVDLVFGQGWHWNADLVTVEGPSLGKPSPHTWDRAGLWWRVVEASAGMGTAQSGRAPSPASCIGGFGRHWWLPFPEGWSWTTCAERRSVQTRSTCRWSRPWRPAYVAEPLAATCGTARSGRR